MALLAVTWKAVWTQRERIGRFPVERPEVRYSGSKPSMQTITVGRVGMVYDLSCRVTVGDIIVDVWKGDDR
jgi:hypothetical protein